MNPLKVIEQEQKPLYLPKKLELANNLIHAFIKNNNVVGLKTLLFLSGKTNRIKWDRNKVELNVDNLCKVLNITRRDLSNNLKRILKISFKYVNDDGGVGETVPIHSYEYVNRNKYIELEVSSLAKRILTELGRGMYSFNQANANNIMSLKHKHSVRIQLLLEQINNFDTVKRKRFTIEELNGYFGTNYKRYIDIERKILIPAKEEIDNNSNLTFIYQVVDEAHGTGRPKIKHITIDLIEQKNIQGRLL